MKIKNEVKVGIFTLIILISLYASIAFLKGSNIFSYKKNKYYVIYNKGGSKVGDLVKINGITVGNVIKTEFLKEGFRIKVSFEIEKDVILTDKVVAVLTGSGLLPGRNSITLTFTEAKGIPLKPGSEIKGMINQSLTEEIMNNSMPLFDDLKSISALISDLASLLAKNQLRINSAIENLEFFTNTVKDYIIKNRDSFDEITRNTSKIIAAFADEKSGLSTLVTNMGNTLKIVNQIDIDEINYAIKEFRKLLSKVQKKGTTIGDLLNNNELYNNLNLSISSLNELLLNVKSEPGRYLHFSVFGKKPVKREK